MNPKPKKKINYVLKNSQQDPSKKEQQKNNKFNSSKIYVKYIEKSSKNQNNPFQLKEQYKRSENLKKSTMQPSKQLNQSYTSSIKKEKTNYQTIYSDSNFSQDYSYVKQQSMLMKQRQISLQMILKNSYPIPDISKEGQLRRIKKLFTQACVNAKNIQIKYCATHPIMFIEYINDGKKQKMLIRDLKKANKSFQKERQIIEVFYDYLYKSVQPEFYNLKKFALLKAQQKHLKLTQKTLKMKISEVMFYYARQQEAQSPINFVIFDRYLNSVDFNDGFIKLKKKELEEQYNLYQKFLKSIKNQDKKDNQQIKDLYGVQQLQSDQQDYKSRQKNDCKGMKNRLQKILQKDLSELKQKIEQKNNQFNDISYNNFQKNTQQINNKRDKLGDQIQQLQILLQNFQQTRQSSLQALKNAKTSDSGYQKLISLNLKKMIIAQKQLDTKLPILAKKRQIFELLNKNNLIILQGQTGSGKSTQLPQMLCQYYKIFDNPDAKPVLVTQPRRLAARTLAQRVAFQMQESVRGFVDYASSIDKQINPEAKIIFKLDRLVLDQLTLDPILSKYSCMVIDQAHQRTISIDVILGLVKQLLLKRKDFKIIVTSASMDTQLFGKYFNTKILKVSGRLFPVDIIYKDYKQSKSIAEKVERVIKQQILNYDRTMNSEYKGNILVFCTGVDQIDNLRGIFERYLNPNLFKIYALHGKIDPKQQKKAFMPTKQHKLIFASRIAETAITIDGVTVVIDPGQDRQLIYDQKTKISTMQLKDISQSSAKQRAGRAGRTKKGFCFRLYFSGTYKYTFKPNKLPQIQNMALDTLVLRLKSLDILDILTFPYITQPNKQGLQTSIQTMKMIGCLDSLQNITAIGKLLIKIPIQPFLSRSIAQALIFTQLQNNKIFAQFNLNRKTAGYQIVDSVIQILGMIINSSNLFYVSKINREICQRIKFKQFSNPDGDFFFFRNIYNQFMRLFTQAHHSQRQNRFNQKKKYEMNNWIKAHFLNIKSLHQVRQLVTEIKSIIKKFPIDCKSLTNQINQCKRKMHYCSNQQQMILSCLVSSFCSNLCLFSGNSDLGYTLFSQKQPIQIYGTSNLSLQGITPKFILSYDFMTNQTGRNYCKVAHEITFQFMENHLTQYVFQKYRLDQAKTINIFYRKIEYKLPTVRFQKILKQHRQKDSKKQKQIFKHTTAYFYEDLNKIDFFYPVDDKMIQQDQKIKKMLQQYIKSVQKQNQGNYQHLYIGNIVIELSDGCNIVNLDLTYHESSYTINCPAHIVQKIQQYFGQYIKISLLKDNGFAQQISVHVLQQNYVPAFQNVINKLKQQFKDFKQSKIVKSVTDKRKKAPQAKLTLRFFAGLPDKGNILINYPRYNKSQTKQMYNSFVHGLLKLNSQIKTNELYQRYGRNSINKHLQKWDEDIKQNIKKLAQNYTISLTKTQKAINIYPKRGHKSLNELDITQILAQMKRNKVLDSKFQLPPIIKMFRLPQSPYCFYSDSQWIHKIKKKFKTISQYDEQNTQIRVWGYTQKPYKNQSDQQDQNYQKQNIQYRIDMRAQITCFRHIFLEKFKHKYDRKKHIIGADQIRCTFQFEKIFAIPFSNVFQSLKDQCHKLSALLREKYPLIDIITNLNTNQHNQYNKNNKFKKVFIKGKSIYRQDLVKAAQVIGNLFAPKIIKLDWPLFKFLAQSSKGQDILSDVQVQYSYKIYFSLEKGTSTLKLFCFDPIHEEVSSYLNNKLKQLKLFSSKISYRGKNLHKALEILNFKKKAIRQQSKSRYQSKDYLYYDVIFQQRCIQITADYSTFQAIKNEILKIVSQQKSQCQLCSDIIQRPFQLMNCNHCFCWNCLSSYIKEFKQNTQNQTLICPNLQCKKKINIYDVKEIFNYEQFEKICDIMTKRFIKKEQKFHQCFSENCEQIFQINQSKKDKSFQCELCGKWYCFQCKQSHKDYSCEQWQYQKKEDSDVQQIKQKTKKCPKCKNNIFQSLGSLYLECNDCKSHVCWNCLKYFKTARQCYYHLKQHQRNSNNYYP